MGRPTWDRPYRPHQNAKAQGQGGSLVPTHQPGNNSESRVPSSQASKTPQLKGNGTPAVASSYSTTSAIQAGPPCGYAAAATAQIPGQQLQRGAC